MSEIWGIPSVYKSGAQNTFFDDFAAVYGALQQRVYFTITDYSTGSKRFSER